MVQCIMCKSSKIDDIKYGKLITKKNISVHYFCLFLTSNLVQNGKDNQGIVGFLLIDIQKEAQRIRNQICCYCGLENAGIGCCDSKCRRIFHLICGIDNGALNQFSETYRSFCNYHIPKILYDKLPLLNNNITCSICYDKINNVKHMTMVCKSPCCKNGWFHKYCLQEFANISGYFFKCPLCNNKDEFRDILVRKGIFVPDQDAAWELEPNAFSELLERPNECSALKCLCSKGRKYNNTNKYEIIFCDTCGSQGIHILCNGDNENDFNCNECIQILNEKTQNNYDHNENLPQINNVANDTINNLNNNNNNDDDDDENEFVVVDDIIENDNNGITAAHAFRISINNHPLANDFSEDFEKILNHPTTINNLNKINNNNNTEEFIEKSIIEKSNNYQPLERRKISESDDDDEIIQLNNYKRRKINNDSYQKIDEFNKIITRSHSRSQSSSDDYNIIINNKNNERISVIYTTDSSQNSPILAHRKVTQLKSSESSEDNIPLTLLVNNKIINKNNERSYSVEKFENKNLNKIITRSHSRSQSSDDNKNNNNNKINLSMDINTPDSGQNSPILQHNYRTRRNFKITIESSDDNLPLKFLTNKNLIQNNTILNEKMKKELNLENDILNNEENSNNISTTSSRGRSRIRQLNDNSSIKNKYFTRSKFHGPSTSLHNTTYTPSKTSLQRNDLSFHYHYQCENSESSLSSADINLKEKNKRVLEDNAKTKQTPINRNIPSSSSSSSSSSRNRFKSHFMKLKTDDDSLSSSSSSLSSNIPNTKINSNLQFKKLRTRLLSTSLEYHQSDDVNCNKNNNKISKTIPVKNSSDINLMSKNKSNKTTTTQSNHKNSDSLIETESDSSSNNILTESLRIESDSDSDVDVFTNIIKNINNNKENNKCKKNTNKNKKINKKINNNNKNDGKFNMNDIRRYLTPNKFYKNQLHF